MKIPKLSGENIMKEKNYAGFPLSREWQKKDTKNNNEKMK